MPHDAPLIWMIVIGFGLAFVFGTLANRLRMPPLVGYLIAGILVGPSTPGFVADTEMAAQLSEIGVILLMFGVGLHFSLKDLLSVQAVAVPGALVMMLGGMGMGLVMGQLLGWPFGGGLVFGLALSVASTVVLLKALQDRHLIESERGRTAVGWVIVEDMAMVLALVLIPTFAGVMGGTAQEVHDPFVDLIERLSGTQLNMWAVLGVIGVKLLAFIGFMLVVGRRVIPWILHATAHSGSRELFRLAVLAIALGVAAGASYVFGVSLALGAFFAGMILSESELSNRAAQESLPFRDAFAVLFFVAVGMLFNPAIIISHPLELLGTLFIILVGKTVLGFIVIRALGRPIGTALTVSVSLAQVGEFSFILAALGVSLGLFPVDGQNYILAGSILSIVLNPLLLHIAEQMRPGLEARYGTGPAIVLPQRVEPGLQAQSASDPTPPADADEEQHPTRLHDHVVLIGYGRVGTVIAEGLLQHGRKFVLVEDAEKRVKAARALGIEVITGNAAIGRSLGLANTAGARCMMVAIPNAFEAGQVVEQARRVNPGLRIIARAHSDDEEVYLRDLGADQVVLGEREIGMGMLDWAEQGGVLRRPAPTGTSDAVAAALSSTAETPAAAAPDPVVTVAPEPAPTEAIAPPAESLPEMASIALSAAPPASEPVPDDVAIDPTTGRALPSGLAMTEGELADLYPATEAIVPVSVDYALAPDATAVDPNAGSETVRAPAQADPAELPQSFLTAMETALAPQPMVPDVVPPEPEPPVASPRPLGPASVAGQPYVPRPVVTPEDAIG